MSDITKICIRNARITDPQSPHNGETVDVLISDDRIEKIGKNLEGQFEMDFSQPNLHLSPGWFDLRANFRDPGDEDKEDLDSGASAALAGGFTAVGLSPETQPVIDSKADIEYIYKKAEEYPLHLFPYGAFTQGLKGEELSEMYDMYEAGAVGFSHGEKVVKNSQVMKLALLYARQFAPSLQVLAYDEAIRQSGVMHEGKQSTWLGLKGIPALSEEMGIARDLKLAHYAEAGIHFNGVSARQSLNLLEDAKGRKESVTADVNLANLVFSDADLENYDSKFKVYPPLRESADQEALISGLKNGIIDVVTSNHQPWAIEDKRCEFDLASFGIAGIECFFGALWGRLENSLSLEQVVELISINPRRVLGLSSPVIKEGEYAEITLFDPDKEWQLSASEQESRAANNPYLNRPLKGQPLGIINKGVVLLLRQ